MNILDSIKGEINSTVIDKISNFLNIARGNTSNAVTAAIPTILGYLSSQAQNQKVANDIYTLSTDKDLSSMFDGKTFQDIFERNRDSLMSKGNSALISLFGNKEAKLSEEIANYSNIGKEASDGILASLLPLILNEIGKGISSNSIDSSNVSSIFENDREAIFSAIPAGLASLVGVLGMNQAKKNINDLANKTSTVKTETINSNKDIMENNKTNNQDDRKTFIKEDDNGGVMKWLLPLLGIIAAAVLIYFLMQQCNEDEAVVTGTEEVIAPDDSLSTSTPVAPIGSYDSTTNRYVYDTGNESQVELPSGESLNVGENSTESKLYNLLSDENSTLDEPVVLDRVYFETGSENIDLVSLEQINRVASILTSYPNARIKIGGYTDNQGGQEINQPLSQQRAETVVKYLVEAGVAADRLEAEGYGQSNFVCPANDTPECLAQNRRVDVTVIAK